MSSQPHPCGNPGCSAPGTSFCSRCSAVRYCSRDCQRTAWRAHSLDCATPAARANQAELAEGMRALLEQFGDVDPGEHNDAEGGGGAAGAPAAADPAAAAAPAAAQQAQARALAARQLLARLAPDWGANVASDEGEVGAGAGAAAGRE